MSRDQSSDESESEPFDLGPKHQTVFTLLWPPTINHAHQGDGRGGRIRTSRTREYVEREAWSIVDQVGRAHDTIPADVPVTAWIVLAPPDRRKRDIDNPVKLILDTLVAAGLLEDDYQVNTLVVMRHEPSPPYGEVLVTLHWSDPK